MCASTSCSCIAYARILYLLDAGAQSSNSTESRLCRTGSQREGQNKERDLLSRQTSVFTAAHIDISHNGWRQTEINRSEVFQRPVDMLDEDSFIMEVQNHNIIMTTRILFIRKTIKRTWHVAQICVNFLIEKVLVVLAVWQCHRAAFRKNAAGLSCHRAEHGAAEPFRNARTTNGIQRFRLCSLFAAT